MTNATAGIGAASRREEICQVLRGAVRSGSGGWGLVWQRLTAPAMSWLPLLPWARDVLAETSWARCSPVGRQLWYHHLRVSTAKQLRCGHGLWLLILRMVERKPRELAN